MLLSEAKLHYNSHVDNGRVQKFTQSQEISAKIYAGSKIYASCLKKNLRTYYDSLTEDWRNFFLQKYKGHIISFHHHP